MSPFRYAVEVVGLTKHPSTIIECAEVRLNSLERAWLLITVGIILIGGLAAIAGMMRNPATIPHSATETSGSEGRNEFGNTR